MRLLERGNAGEIYLTEVLPGEDVPPYAILSHTWGPEEVSFRDFLDGAGENKLGYDKIRFCGDQSFRDDLRYFWVDTCCIDKASSAELQESINCMFRWYGDATKCYVYLADVSRSACDSDDELSKPTWESAFRKSRWFTRGWTLQELIAPTSVEFFSKEGVLLGNKRSLEQHIHDVTGIPVEALRGGPLSNFSIQDRMAWMEARETTRKEDTAYSMFGIFDIQMPLLYGEGRDKALKRLREEVNKTLIDGVPSIPVTEDAALRSAGGRQHKTVEDDALLALLPSVAQAAFNYKSKQDDPLCLPGTRIDLLKLITEWADDKNNGKFIFWLSGMAGTGKSTIARTVSRYYYEQNQLGASFFFSRGGGEVSRAENFVTSIAIQLAKMPYLKRHILEAVAEHQDIAGQTLRDQWNQLIIRPLSQLNGITSGPTIILVVDALDECDDERDIRLILQLFAETGLAKADNLRILLTSRPEIPVRYGLCQIQEAERQNFVLHDICPDIVDNDISIFLKHHLNQIMEERGIASGWPDDQDIKRLVQNANGLFIWAATTCRFVREGRRHAVNRLSKILRDDSAITAPEKQLDEIYTTVLRQCVQDGYDDEEKADTYRMLKGILGSIIILYSCLSAESLARLLCVPEEDIDQTLEELHAILDIPSQRGHPIRLHHPSLRDFLLSKTRCRDPNFWVDEKQAHKSLADNCIHLMCISLNRNICELNALDTRTADIESGQLEQYLPPEVQYACLYWVQHLQKGCDFLSDNDDYHRFLQTHFLLWLEALSYISKISEGIRAITSLESIVDGPNFSAFLHDAKRFILFDRSVIESAPQQIYYSALLFAPEESMIRQQFKQQIPNWVCKKLGGEKTWGPAFQTIEAHSRRVNSVAFSPDGKLIASASDDHTVKLWSTATGVVQQTFTGHSSLIWSVAFSPDSQLVASTSADRTVKLWSTDTGAVQQTLQGHSDWVNSVAFSPDGELVASASDDRTVRLWDTATGAARRLLKGHLGWINSVAFSPDGKLLASASDDRTARLWKVATGATYRTLQGHSGWVNSVAFSPDGTLVASASHDLTIKLWETSTGVVKRALEGHLGRVNSVAFSPDGSSVISASVDRTVKLWDVTTGAVRQTFEGHSGRVRSVAFSPDSKLFASASVDRTVRLWDAAITRQTLEGHSGRINAIAFSPDGKFVASASHDCTVKLWDSVTGAISRTLHGHSNWVNAIIFSQDGKLIASASVDHTIRLWDAATGITVQTFKGHSGWINCVAFSPDNNLIGSASDDDTVRLWDAATGEVHHTLQGHSDWVNSAVFSSTGNLIASASDDSTVRLWDTATGATQWTLKGHSDSVNSAVFSLDDKLVVSGSDDHTVRLWDACTGEVRRIFEGHLDSVWSVAFSPDANLIASASRDHTVRLWDASTGTLWQVFEGHLEPVWSIAFSSNGNYLETDRGQLTLRSNHLATHQQHSSLPYTVFVRDHWVTRDMEKLLWLPPDYRSQCLAVWKNILVFGHSSGYLTFLSI